MSWNLVRFYLNLFSLTELNWKSVFNQFSSFQTRYKNISEIKPKDAMNRFCVKTNAWLFDTQTTFRIYSLNSMQHSDLVRCTHMYAYVHAKPLTYWRLTLDSLMKMFLTTKYSYLSLCVAGEFPLLRIRGGWHISTYIWTESRNISW